MDADHSDEREEKGTRKNLSVGGGKVQDRRWKEEKIKGDEDVCEQGGSKRGDDEGNIISQENLSILESGINDNNDNDNMITSKSASSDSENEENDGENHEITNQQRSGSNEGNNNSDSSDGDSRDGISNNQTWSHRTNNDVFEQSENHFEYKNDDASLLNGKEKRFPNKSSKQLADDKTISVFSHQSNNEHTSKNNTLTGQVNQIMDKNNNAEGNNDDLSPCNKVLSSDENYSKDDEKKCITHEKINITEEKNNTKEMNTSNDVFLDEFEENNFFENDFSNFQKAEENVEEEKKKKKTLIDIYNEMKNYEENFLNNFERTYENIEEEEKEEGHFIKSNEDKESSFDVDFNSIESISSTLNGEGVDMMNDIPVVQCLRESINFFVEEQKRQNIKKNKKNKKNKNYLSLKSYMNSLPPNVYQKIFKEYKKTVCK
ncbi:conserved Plasmodium protein, unknown function [Plasmodium malariae]|uniref:Uncharacterized protein n=1 Tax=Plasmodium malariae TaxID=5858 RepID=A0A1C3KYL1_PLAMA|nr:conserved Plasmodium protein, unknown function [Plasmodium malariae]